MLVSGLKGKSKYYQLDLNALDAMLLKIEMDGSPSNA